MADGGISIRAFSIADTTDFGILRLIVSDTDKAAKVLKEHGVAVSITEVVGISIPDVTGALPKLSSFFPMQEKMLNMLMLS